MNKILHISAECYPAAKAGGLGDVVGALPKYLNRRGFEASVVIPKYKTDWIDKAETRTIFEGTAPYGLNRFSFTIEQVEGDEPGFPLYLANIPRKFDREGIYTDPWSGHGFWDEMDRFFSFQIAVLEWVAQSGRQPDLVHCHDHHAALVPFMMTQCYRFDKLDSVPTVLTIHNGEYQGRYDLHSYTRIPAFNLDAIGLEALDHAVPARRVGERAVDENDREGVVTRCLRHERLLSLVGADSTVGGELHRVPSRHGKRRSSSARAWTADSPKRRAQ
jgi:starch synthase